MGQVALMGENRGYIVLGLETFGKETIWEEQE